jgi:tight adherence protein B
MSGSQLAAMTLVGAGMALLVVGVLMRVYNREERLADILDLPWGEKDVDLDAAVEQHSSLVENTIGVAGRLIDQVDAEGSFLTLLERSRLPVRPGEFALLVVSFAVIVGCLVTAVTTSAWFGIGAAVATPFTAIAYLKRRISGRRRKFEEGFPDALTLIASSLSAGHTFLRSIQMMCEEAEGPIAEEFGRVVQETRLGDPLVDSLERMAKRVDIRDVDWVVQAIRIQQTVGGKLAELLHTLADFIRAREEVRRDVAVLTAEGRVSAYVLTALAPLMFLAIQVLSPGYMQPMFQGWGLVVLGFTAALMAVGSVIIFRMCKIEV